MRILVAGGAGFVGSHLVRTILTGGYPELGLAAVTVLDKLTYSGNEANLEPVAGRFEFVRGDICDGGLLAEVVPGHDLVINFAAETHVDRSIAGPAPFVTTNVTGVQVLMQACLDASVRRVVQVSTDEVYGSIDAGSWREDAALQPRSPYSAAKAGGDLVALAYHRTYGLDVVITRCCNNYGPYQYPEKLIPLFITNLLEGRQVPLYGDGSNVREWLHVDDHCRGVLVAARAGQPGRVYHIGGGVEMANRDMTSLLLAALGADWESVDHVADRKGHDRRYSIDDSALRALGYGPRVGLADGLAATVRWYATHRSWWSPLVQRAGAEASAHEAAAGRPPT